jgi:sporulation protein YlmC with PRC-barrel domain
LVKIEICAVSKEERMNRRKTLIAVVSIAGMLLAPVVFAQERERVPGPYPATPPSRPGAQEPVAPKATVPETPPVPKASVFIGSSVVNEQGESLGKIDDLVIDPASGQIKYAALSHGSILGLGGKLFAVAWEALKLQPDGKTFVLNVSKETLDNGAGFDKNNWPQQPDPMLSAAAPGTSPATKPSAAMSRGTGVSATVQEVNAQAETIKLKTEHGESVELQAPAAALEGLQAGDAVEVKIAGTRATEIRKKE